MYFNSIDDLIYEVNKVALLPDAEVLRLPCIRYAQQVYKKVGYNKISLWFEEQFDVVNMSITLPITVYKVDDVLWNPTNDTEYNPRYYIGMYAKSIQGSGAGRPMYRVEGNKIRFFSEHVKQVKVVYQSLPVNDEGELLIDDRIYDACVAFARGEELMVKSSNTKQERSTLNPAMVYMNNAKALIDEARAHINQSTLGEWREYLLHTKNASRSYEYEGN